MIRTGNEWEKDCKTGSAHDSSRDLALGALQSGACLSACSDVDCFIVQTLQAHKFKHWLSEMSKVCVCVFLELKFKVRLNYGCLCR